MNQSLSRSITRGLSSGLVVPIGFLAPEGGGAPANAMLDEVGQPVLDENDQPILDD